MLSRRLTIHRAFQKAYHPSCFLEGLPSVLLSRRPTILHAFQKAYHKSCFPEWLFEDQLLSEDWTVWWFLAVALSWVDSIINPSGCPDTTPLWRYIFVCKKQSSSAKLSTESPELIQSRFVCLSVCLFLFLALSLSVSVSVALCLSVCLALFLSLSFALSLSLSFSLPF